MVHYHHTYIPPVNSSNSLSNLKSVQQPFDVTLKHYSCCKQTLNIKTTEGDFF